MMVALMTLACGSPTLPSPPPPTEHHEHQAPPAPAPVAAAPALAEAVAKLGTQRAQLSGLLDAGKLSEVHPVCEEMTTTAVRAAAGAGSLPADDQNTITLAAADLKAVLDELHDAADAGKPDEAKAALAKVDADLAKLERFK